MVTLKELKFNLERIDNDSLLDSALELSKELEESMQSSTFIALQDAINSKSSISIIEGVNFDEFKLITTDFIFIDGR